MDWISGPEDQAGFLRALTPVAEAAKEGAGLPGQTKKWQMCCHFIRLNGVHRLGPRTREQPIKIHASNCKMWNRGLVGLPREGNVCRVDSPSSLAICFPYVSEIQNSTNKRLSLAPSFPHSFFWREDVLRPGTQ